MRLFGEETHSTLEARLCEIVRADEMLISVLTTARDLELPDWRLVAGCLYQTVWNQLTNRPAGHGIRDYDLVYFDGNDLSYDGEDVVIRRCAQAFGELRPPVEVRNQARVHLWFEKRFGAPYAPLASTDEGIGRYAATAHCVGIRLEPNRHLDVAAPYGLTDIFDMILRPNPTLPNAPSYGEKAARAKACWPELTIIPWD